MYPWPLLNRTIEIAPLLGSQFQGSPFVFNLSKDNPVIWDMDVADQVAFQRMIDEQLQLSGNAWGLCGYLERRESLLRDLDQMVSEKRFVHMGLDIMVPEGTVLHAPLDAEIVESGYEEGKGNRQKMGCRIKQSCLWGMEGLMEK